MMKKLITISKFHKKVKISNFKSAYFRQLYYSAA